MHWVHWAATGRLDPPGGKATCGIKILRKKKTKKSPWHAFAINAECRSSLWCAGAATCSKSFLRVKCEARWWDLMMSLGSNPNSPVKLVPVSPLYIPGCLHIQVFKLDWIKINSHLHRLIFPSVSVAKLIADWHEVATANQEDQLQCPALQVSCHMDLGESESIKSTSLHPGQRRRNTSNVHREKYTWMKHQQNALELPIYINHTHLQRHVTTKPIKEAGGFPVSKLLTASYTRSNSP